MEWNARNGMLHSRGEELCDSRRTGFRCILRRDYLSIHDYGCHEGIINVGDRMMTCSNGKLEVEDRYIYSFATLS